MIASSFNILEDTSIYTDDDTTSQITSTAGIQRKASKGLALRTTVGPNQSNIRAGALGPQKLRLNSQSSTSRKSNGQRKKSISSSNKSSSKNRSFGVVLTTDNHHSKRTHGAKKGQQRSKAPPAKTAPKATRKTKNVLRPVQQNVTPIELCFKGPGKYKYVDEEEVSLMRTNKNAKVLYHQMAVAPIMNAAPLMGSTGPVIAPVDDIGFEIFEDDADETNAKSETIAAVDDDLPDFEDADLW